MATEDGGRRVREYHRDDEHIDEVRIEVAPRYKTSGLSGDEWRTGVVARAYRKGVEVAEFRYGKMEWALRLLDGDLVRWVEQNGIPRPKGFCMQYGCAEPATNVYRMKKRYCRLGHDEDLSKGNPFGNIYIREFCDRHSRRGDCGLDDADRNYDVIEGDGPEGGRDTIDESPSGFGGVVGAT